MLKIALGQAVLVEVKGSHQTSASKTIRCFPTLTAISELLLAITIAQLDLQRLLLLNLLNLHPERIINHKLKLETNRLKEVTTKAARASTDQIAWTSTTVVAPEPLLLMITTIEAILVSTLLMLLLGGQMLRAILLMAILVTMNITVVR